MNKQSRLAPAAGPAPLSGSAATLRNPHCDPAKPWGHQPVCEVCNLGKHTNCICNVPDPEPEYFRPGVRLDPDGWARVEL